MSMQFTESSSLLRCTPAIAQDVLAMLEMLSEFSQFGLSQDAKREIRSKCPDFPEGYGDAIADYLIETLPFNAYHASIVKNEHFVATLLSDSDYDLTFFGFDVSFDEKGLWFKNQEAFDGIKAASFAHAIMAAYKIQGVTKFSVAYWCDSPMIDEFGGDLYAATKDGVYELNKDEWLEAIEASEKDRMNYYYLEMQESFGELNYSSRFLITVTLNNEDGINLGTLVNDLFNYSPYIIGFKQMAELEPHEFYIMNKYIPVISYDEIMRGAEIALS